MANRNKLRERRNKLYKEDPYCIYCGVKMILPEEIPDLPDKPQGGKVEYPDNMCTIEHIYPKNDPRRLNPQYFGIIRRIICCRRCNFLKGIETEKEFTPKSHKKKRIKKTKDIYSIDYSKVKLI